MTCMKTILLCDSNRMEECIEQTIRKHYLFKCFNSHLSQLAVNSDTINKGLFLASSSNKSDQQVHSICVT